MSLCVCTPFFPIDFSFLFVKYLIIFFYTSMSILSLSFPSDCFLFVFSREEKRVRSDGMQYMYPFSIFTISSLNPHISLCVLYCLLMKNLEQMKKKQKSRKVDKKKVLFLFYFCFSWF